MKVKVLFEDKDIIVCEKPAGLPSQGDRSLSMDMVSVIKNHIYEQEGTTNPYVGVVHRLDRGVGGVMVYAKTKNAAANLSAQVQQKQMQKRYLAVVSEEVPLTNKETWIRLEDYLIKDGRSNLSKVVTKGTKDAKLAVLEYQCKGTKQLEEGEASLLEIKLHTGRHHQIRVQLSQIMTGIWGDTKYNEQFKSIVGWKQIALYSHSLTFVHPHTKKEMTFEEIPTSYPFSSFHNE